MLISSKNILVVGGAGFIGSHMVLALKQAGFCPIVLDNLSHGHADAVLGAQLIVGEMADTHLLNNIFKEHAIVAVMHFASFIEVAESVTKPIKYYLNNVGATLNLLEVMLQHQVPYFIFSSSAAVYGQPQYLPIDETHPLIPINPYGHSKYMVERVIQDLAVSNHLNYAILRYFNTAGADPGGRLGERHEPESHLIPLLLQVAQGKRKFINIYGKDYPTLDGTCIRDYIHVVDLCEAHLLALQYLLTGKNNMICNVGTGHGYSILEVVQAAEKITQRTISIEYSAKRCGDPSSLISDNRHAKKLLNWYPKSSELHNIIRDTWNYVQQEEGEKVSNL